MSWYSGLRAKILFDEPLSRHTSLRVGPKAGLWIEPYDIDSLRSLLKAARAKKKDYLVIGLGSKLLIKKKKLPLAIHLGSHNFTKAVVRGNDIIVGAGAPLGRLIKAAYDNGLGGLEFLNGIPASVGGAIMLNAGVSWPQRIEIGTFIHQLEVMDKYGRIRIINKKDLEFGYRYSNLRQYIILSARFRLFKKRKENIKVKMRRFRDYRMKTQELGVPSAGCVFKNSEGLSSGSLIDQCGLKGSRIGGAVISNKHANFIINRGKASAKDILALMRMVKREVQKRFKINLKPEIELI